MSDTAAQAAWLSAHLHFDGRLYESDGDRAVLEFTEPFVRRAFSERWITRYFFVRYAEDGSHIRLRLNGLPDVLKATVRPALEEHVAASRSALDSAMAPGGAQGTPTEIRWIPYVPETERYGGVAAIDVAERVFDASSRVAVRLLESIDPGDRDARLGKALLAMLVAIHCFQPQRQQAALFATVYATREMRGRAQDPAENPRWRGEYDDHYKRQAPVLGPAINEAWRRLEEGDPLPERFHSWQRDLAAARSELRQLCAAGHLQQRGHPITHLLEANYVTVPSYIHMMMNRLGVTVPEEAYLARLIMRALKTDA